MGFTDRAVRFLQNWKRFVNAVESLLIDVIAATSPWLAPLLPAYMTWYGMYTEMQFPVWVCYVGAAIVESLGLSAITTTFQFWDWNDEKRKSDQQAPFWVAAITAGFYMAVVLLLNVFLDVDSTVIKKITKGLLSSFSVCAGVILAVRSSHARRIEAIAQERAERKEERLQFKLIGQRAVTDRTVTGQQEPPDSDRTVTGQSDWRDLPQEDRDIIRGMGTREIMQKYGCSERAARRWKNYSMSTNGNGHHAQED